MSDKDGSIFGSTPEAADQQPQVASNQQEGKRAEASSVIDPYADLLNGIRTEDGRPKYATVSDAINSIPHAQKHISTLETELNEMREKFRAMEERANTAVGHLETQRSQQDANFGEDQVVGLVDRVLSQREQQANQQKNVQAVVSALTDKFGSTEAADKAYRQKAAEMGVNLDMMNSLAMHSPSAILAYFGTTGASAPTRTEGTLNSANLPKGEQPKGKNPLLTGSMKDMQAEISRIYEQVNKQNGY